MARPLRAQAQAYGGPYWVMVNASGGWDPTFLFNPTMNATHNRRYTEIRQVGAIPFAPIPIDIAAMGLDAALPVETYAQHMMSNEAFLTKYGSRLTVLNGVDTSTNNHDSGTRTTWCGRIPEGYPTLAAMVAAAKAPEKPIAFLSAGGYDATQGLVPLTRIASAASMKRLAYPNRLDPNNAQNQDLYHTLDTYNRIRAAQDERLTALQNAQQLPRLKAGMSQLYAARQSDNELESLEIPATLVDLPGQLGDLERFNQQAQLALAAFKAGLAVSANLQLGGFDTHSDHNRGQSRQLAKLLGGVNFLMDQAAAQGLGDKLIVLVGSDFGRGPHYNAMGDNGGKDHWPISTVLAMGPGIAGDRVIGATNDEQRARPIDPGTLTAIDSGGTKITPQLIHVALRRLAGLEGTEVANKFPLLGDALPLFG
jgi:hypothetical protein